ncbi:MAG: hypothetical protein O2970_10355 [Proteobacteria bacterium]|nr:hypothetical protein [Pseudomonadota bacterium]MDA0967343.1 hypothetical protein [Pseudomonadota bacterium]
MKIFLNVTSCLLLTIFLAFPSYGNDDKLISDLMQVAREQITSAKLLDGSFVPAETEEEKKTPIIKIEDARRIVGVGQQSAIAAWCNVEWYKSSFTNLMQHERSKEIWSDKQLAYIGLLHGITMGMTEKSVKQRGECPSKQASHINNIISKRLFNN